MADPTAADRSPRFSPRTVRRIYAGIVVLVIVLAVERHVSAGYALPVPWPDESSFLWQSVAFANHATLLAPELNPAREVMWMPPGYMITMGLVFKLAGTSLSAARTFSLIAVLASFVLFAAVMFRRPFPIVAVVLLGAAFLTFPVVAIANTARMDALLLLFAALSLWLFHREQPAGALAIIVLSPLVHPNGLVLALVAVAHLLVSGQWRGVRMRWQTGALAAIVLIAWGAYAWHVSDHWTAFRSDMGFQFLLKSAKQLPLLVEPNLTIFVLFLAAAVYAFFTDRTSSPVLWFAGGLWAVYGVGLQAWYECYYMIALALMLATIIPSIARLATTGLAHMRSRYARMAIIAALLVVLVYATSRTLQYQHVALPFNANRWYGMRVGEADVPYITPTDRERVQAYLDSLQQSATPVNVQFFPEADAFLYHDVERGAVRVCQGTFYDFEPGIFVVHVSRYIPSWWTNDFFGKLKAMGIDRHDPTCLLRARDSSESFHAFVYPRPWNDPPKR